MATKQDHTEKVAAPGIGNAIAYFLVIYVASQGLIEEGDKVEAVAFGGAIITYVLLQVRAAFTFVADMIERIASHK